MTPYVGQIVHYVLPSGPNTGSCRAAIVVDVSDWLTEAQTTLEVLGAQALDGAEFASRTQVVAGESFWHNCPIGVGLRSYRCPGSYGGPILGTWHAIDGGES